MKEAKPHKYFSFFDVIVSKRRVRFKVSRNIVFRIITETKNEIRFAEYRVRIERMKKRVKCHQLTTEVAIHVNIGAFLYEKLFATDVNNNNRKRFVVKSIRSLRIRKIVRDNYPRVFVILTDFHLRSRW